MRGAVAFVEANSRPDEEIIVNSPLLYFPALYHLNNRMTCKLYSDGKPFAHYRGAPLITDRDLIFDQQMNQMEQRRVWIISGGWADTEIPLPIHWRLETRKAFPEVFAFQEIGR